MILIVVLEEKKHSQSLRSKIRPGSVIVLHDSKSSCANLILDEFLGYAVRGGI